MVDGAIRDILESSIDQLPDDLRSVFVTCVVDGRTTAYCAQMFALTSDTVEQRLTKARSLLVDALMRQLHPAFGAIFQLEDSHSERITNAVLERLFPRR